MAILVALVPYNTPTQSTLQASLENWQRLVATLRRSPRTTGLAKLIEQELPLATGPDGAKRITLPRKQADAIREAASRTN